MALTDTKIRKAKPNGKVQKLNDGDGLRLEISKAGTKAFKYRYQVNGKDSNITLGAYPSLSLAKARIKRDELKALVRQDINPIEQKQQAKQKQNALEQAKTDKLTLLTLSQLFEQWHNHNESGWTYKYAVDVRNRITQHLLPTLGDSFIDEITPQQIIYTLKQMEAKGLGDSIRKVQQYASRMFRYGVGLGLCSVDPVRDIPAGDIFKKQTKQNLAHLTKPNDLYQLLNAIDTYLGDIATTTALKLAPHVFLRPSELAGLRWSEIDLNINLITIEAERMKMKRPHIVPLSKQAKELIQSMDSFKESSPFVFPSPRTTTRHINEQSLNAGLKRLGFGGKHTAHGFRHTASTLLNEQGFNRDWVEMQLAHSSGDSVRGTYNKAEYLTGRVKMMQAWSNHIDGLKTGADMIKTHNNQAG
jgi:integrase